MYGSAGTISWISEPVAVAILWATPLVFPVAEKYTTTDAPSDVSWVVGAVPVGEGVGVSRAPFPPQPVMASMADASTNMIASFLSVLNIFEVSFRRLFCIHP